MHEKYNKEIFNLEVDNKIQNNEKQKKRLEAPTDKESHKKERKINIYNTHGRELM